MAYPETVPTTHIVGDSGHTVDHNTIVTVLGDLDVRVHALEPASASSFMADADNLATGFSSIHRMFTLSGGSNVGLTSGEIQYTHFTAPSALVCNTMRICIETARSGGTVTLAKVGIFTAGADGAPTITAAVVSDITMFDVAGDKDLALGAPYTFVRGNRYAIGVVGIAGTAWGTAPTLAGTRNAPAAQQIGFRAPMLMSRRTGQTDLVGATLAQMLSTAARAYVEFIP